MRILGTVASSSREVPNAPTIGTATNVGTGRAFNNGAASVTFTAPTFDGGLPITSYTVTSSPGGFAVSGASSPITVTGLQSNTAYTFTVTASNSRGASAASAASNSITATTVPQAPTVGTPTCATGQAYTGSANISVPFTANATGGAAISSYTVTSSISGTVSGGSSPLTISQTVGSTYTYTVTATNANGTSAASSASASVLSASVPQAPTIGTATATSGSATVAYTANATGGSAVTTFTATSSPGSLTGTGASPITVSGLTNGTAYTFTVTATNAYGTSVSSSASNSVTPASPALGAWSTVGSVPVNRNYASTATSASALWLVGGNNSGAQVEGYNSSNGASWGNFGNIPASRWQASGVWDGTRFQNLGGLNASNAGTADTTFSTGGAFSTGTSLPQTLQGNLAGWSIGSAVAANGFWAGGADLRTVYFRTGTGAWSTGTQAPLVVGGSGFDGFVTGQMVSNNARTIAYGYQTRNYANSSTAFGTFFTQTTIGGTWTQGPTAPYIVDRPGTAITDNGFLFMYGGGGNFLGSYQSQTWRWNGSAWSNQNAMPTAKTNGMGNGQQGNNIFAYSGDSASSVNSPAVFRATQN